GARSVAQHDSVVRARAGDLRRSLAAGLQQRRRSPPRGIWARPDLGPRLLGTLRGCHAGRQIAAQRGKSSRSGSEKIMTHYIARRLAYSLLSLFLLSLTIFLFVRVTGDPAVLL